MNLRHHFIYKLGHKEFEEDFKALGKVIEINLVTLTENSSFFGGFLKSLKDIESVACFCFNCMH